MPSHIAGSSRLPEAVCRSLYSELPSMPTWYSVLIRLRERFAAQLTAAMPELDVLLNSHLRDSAYLIEAATLIGQNVGAAAFGRAVVELTTPIA
jgi:hypothetical protein